MDKLILVCCPALILNKSFSSKLSLNLKAENRQQFGAFNPSTFNSAYTGDFFYVTPLLVYKYDAAHKFAMGYLARFRSGNYNQRFIQQYIQTYAVRGYKLGLRLVTDQTITHSNTWQFRFRWRNNILLPLKGELADKKEAYFKLNQELLAIHTKQINDIEARLVPSFGWVFNKNNKLELGLDYRVANFITKNTSAESDIRLAINWYLKIP